MANKSMTQDEFIRRAKAIHGDKYDYSCTKYVNMRTKILVRCPIHGIFEQDPVEHLRGQGCRECGIAKRRKPVEKFIEQAREVHGDKYDYSKVKIINNHTPVIIICPEHGEFLQAPSNHLKGQGCPHCYGYIKFTTEQFIQRAEAIHGKGTFDYSMVDYKGYAYNIKLKCNTCGRIFTILAGNILLGYGCIECSYNNMRLGKEEWVKRAKEVHGERYDYSRVKYKSLRDEVEIGCPVHGFFMQNARSHIQGRGCRLCAYDTRRKTLEEWIAQVNEIHNFKYDYSRVNYVNARTDVEIICPEHGVFIKTPNEHLMGKGCPECSKLLKRSKGEIEMCEYIKSIYSGEIIENSRKLIGGKELDIYIPELKLAFEYNGDYWHEIAEERDPGYHENKRNACKERGIELIEIWESKWKKDPDQIKLLIQEEIKKAESNQWLSLFSF